MNSKALLNTNELAEDHSLGFNLEGDVNLFAVKKDGKIYLYKNSCPHLGIELEWVEHQFLDASNALIQCSTHGAQFIIESGECVSGPCMGQALSRIDFHIDDKGMLWIT
ncbi:MAG: Rieske 2Fe-2S domain-containing protein [Pseudomonadales bacterium]|nr:Rieske 2Fe-2S domain-containing protein [Pseudomonadales bacterium]